TAGGWLGQVRCRWHGAVRMHDCAQAALFHALRELGYCIDSPNERLPALIHGVGPRKGTCCVSIAESSQFASALLLCAKAGRWQVLVVGDNAEESPYVSMTTQLIATFPHRGGTFHIEPDASCGSYFWAAAALLTGLSNFDSPAALPLRVVHWPDTGWQVDEQFPALLRLPERLSRLHQLGDSILTAMVLAPFGSRPTQFTDLGRLRV